MATMVGDISHTQQCNELGVYEGEGVLRLKAISNNNYPGATPITEGEDGGRRGKILFF